MVQFAEKVVSELFTVKTSKAVDAGALNLSSTKEKYEFIGRSIGNNSIQGYLSDKAKPYFDPNEANTITISQIGQQIATYHENEYYASQNMFVLKPIDFKLNRITGLYFTTIFNCQLKQYLGSYTSYPTQNDVKQWKIKVPVTATGELDTEYMASYVRKIEASYVRKIEASYVRKIEAYLSVLGYKSLADCQLTQHDLDVLHSKPKMKKFKIGNLFKKLSSKYLGTGNKFDAVSKYKNTLYSVPVTYAKYDNNGIMYWAKKGDFEVHKNCISIIYNGAVSAGLVFAQQEPTGVLAESYLISLQNKKVSFKTNLYLTTALKKAIYPIYSREYLATWNKVKSDTITLPVTSSGDPDWQFMDDYITAIEKLKILKLKQFLDHKLDLYQKVIN